MRAATCEGQEGGSGGARLLDPAGAGQLAPVSAIELRPASRNDIASRHCVTKLRHESCVTTLCVESEAREELRAAVWLRFGCGAPA